MKRERVVERESCNTAATDCNSQDTGSSLGTRHTTHDTRRKTQDTRHKTHDTRRKTQDTRHKTHDERHKTQDTRHKTHDTRHKTHDTRHSTLSSLGTRHCSTPATKLQNSCNTRVTKVESRPRLVSIYCTERKAESSHHRHLSSSFAYPLSFFSKKNQYSSRGGNTSSLKKAHRPF